MAAGFIGPHVAFENIGLERMRVFLRIPPARGGKHAWAARGSRSLDCTGLSSKFLAVVALCLSPVCAVLSFFSFAFYAGSVSRSTIAEMSKNHLVHRLPQTLQQFLRIFSNARINPRPGLSFFRPTKLGGGFAASLACAICHMHIDFYLCLCSTDLSLCGFIDCEIARSHVPATRQ